MTAEETAAINKVWDMQPKWFQEYIEKFFTENIKEFQGMEKERVISVMNKLYLEYT